MTLNEKILYHQIHPAKLAADIGAEIVSLPFLWYHWLAWGLATHFAPTFIASALMLRFGDFERIKHSPRGHYLKRYMTLPVEAIRFAADFAMMVAAWFHLPLIIAAGIVVVIAAWTYGMVRPKRA
jgi:hypothetical protein